LQGDGNEHKPGDEHRGDPERRRLNVIFKLSGSLFLYSTLVGHNKNLLLVSVYPETASFSPGRRFRFFAILGIGSLCLWLQKRSGLALNQNLLFPNGHSLGVNLLQDWPVSLQQTQQS
jgi:hypothetical protein